MRKNRKMPQKLSVVAVHAMHMGAVMAMLFVMVIFNMLAMSRCSHLENSIGAKEKQLGRLEDEYQRQATRWQEMQTSENLERALVRHGLSMHYPNASQLVRMDSSGRPYAGQLSLAKAAKRAQAAATATASVTHRRVSSARRR